MSPVVAINQKIMSNDDDNKYEPLLTAEGDVVENEMEQDGTEHEVEQEEPEERNLPRATAVFEDLESKPRFHQDTKPKRYVEVIAPCDLPKGYRLPVKYQDLEQGRWVSGFAIVPEKGVYRGETFKAQLAEARPFMGGWAVGEFDCGSNRDSGFSILSLFCKYLFVGNGQWKKV